LKLLALDLSTKSTGYAIFDLKTKKLLEYGNIKPKSFKGISKFKYPAAAYYRIVSIADQVNDLVLEVEPSEIIIEEINRGISRLGQKSLDALHFFVLDYLNVIDSKWLEKVKYKDSNGKTGWRGDLGLKLSKEDKEHNKKAKKNKAKKVDWKKLAERYVNAKFNTKFDVWKNTSDADVVDAICIGLSYFSK